MASFPVFQIRLGEGNNCNILVHTPEAADLFSWQNAASSKSEILPQTLFAVQFISTTNPAELNNCHISLGVSSDSFLSVDAGTGAIGISSDSSTASIFQISSISNWSHQKPPAYNISVVGDDGSAKSTLGLDTKTRRAAFVSALDQAVQASVNLQYVPLSTPINDDHDTQSVFLKMFNHAKGAYAVSKPGNHIVASNKNEDKGWDIFRFDHIPNEKACSMFDARLSPFTVMDTGGRNSVKVAMAEMLIHQLDSPRQPSKVEIIGLDEKSVSRANAVSVRSSSGYFSMEKVTNRNRDVTIVAGNGSANEEWSLYLALPSDVEVSKPRVSVTGIPKGIRRVCSEIQLATSLELAYEVITDYADYKNFVSDCTESEITEEQTPTEFKTRMVQTTTFLRLSIPSVTNMQHRLDPTQFKVKIDLISGQGIRHYDGLWWVAPLKEDDDAMDYDGEQQCRICYVIEGATSLPTPGFLLDPLLHNASERLMNELKAEIMKRANE